jgi:hypothetical protein
MSHRLFLLALVLLPALPFRASAESAMELLGCWQGETVVQYFADGRSSAQPAVCSLKYTADTIESQCDVGQANSVITYAYQGTRPGVYTAKIVTHALRPDLVGGERDYEYRVEQDHLYITTNPQTTRPAPPTAAVRVESVSRKATCK